jgi:hypothetical protein
LGVGELSPAFYFPPQINRKKCSALMFNCEGTPVAFAKLAWGSEEINQTKNEKDGYLFVNQKTFRNFETPKILFSGEFDGRYYNLLSVFPPVLKIAPKNWGEVYQHAWEEFSSSTTQSVPLKELQWWNKRRNWKDKWRSAFEIVERHEHLNGYRFCKAHGDFSIWNARVSFDRLYLFDWEFYEEEAPLFLDPFYFFLSREFLLNKVKDTASVMKTFGSEFESISKFHPQFPDLLLVIIYLKIHNQGSNLSKELDDLASTLMNS